MTSTHIGQRQSVIIGDAAIGNQPLDPARRTDQAKALATKFTGVRHGDDFVRDFAHGAIEARLAGVFR